MYLADHTVVVSLKRRPERRAHFEQAAHRIGLKDWSYFDAMDGVSMGLSATHGTSSRPAGVSRPMTPGEAGCYVSHLGIVRSALALGVDTLCVLEDDVDFISDFEQQWKAFIHRLPEDWQILHLGIAGESHWKSPTAVNDHVHRIHGTWGTYFYVLRREAMKAFAQHPRADEMKLPIDDILCDLQTRFATYGPRMELVTLPKLGTDCDVSKETDPDYFEDEDAALAELIRCQRENLFERGKKLGDFLYSECPSLRSNWRFFDTYALHLYYVGETAKSLELSFEAMRNRSCSEDDLQHIRTNKGHAIAKLSRRWDEPNQDLVQEMGAILDRNRSVDRSKLVTVTQTTCKRLDLFRRTVSSILHAFEDKELIGEWIVIDDQSSADDRTEMVRLFPFIRFIFKTPEEKGHARSMNMLLSEIQTPFNVHLEDDWQFFRKDRFIEKALDVISHNPTYGQCCFNRNYGEDETNWDYPGGFMQFTMSGLRYYIHEHPTRQSTRGASKAYWPHFSLQPSVWRMSAIRAVAPFVEMRRDGMPGFEMEFARRYTQAGYQTTFFDSIQCVHIGRKTYERTNPTKKNAYDLNSETQW